MPLNIISNFAANVAHRNLTMSDAQATNSLAKLSAGTRVLSAKDDAASMAVGSRLKVEVMGLKTAAVNAGQAVSMLQVADGAMAQVNDILTRMKQLAVQSGSDQLSGTERSMLDTEYQSLLSEIDRVSADTDFAGQTLVDGALNITRDSANASQYLLTDGLQNVVFRGDFGTLGSAGSTHTVTIDYNGSGAFSVSVGTTDYTGAISSDAISEIGTTGSYQMATGTVVTLSNSTATAQDEKIDLVLNTAWSYETDAATAQIGVSGSNQTSFTYKVGTGVSSAADDISVSVNSISASALTVGGGDITSAANADTASQAVSNAIDDIQTYRANIGASQNRLEFAAANIATQTENTEAARSQLLDLDIASEMSNFTSKQILVQAGVSMLAQANQLPQNLLRLFQ